MLGAPESSAWPRAGGYRATSPTTGELTRYDEEEIWREVGRIEEEARESGWPFVQSLYLQAPHFVHPDRLVTPDAIRWLEDYRMCQSMNVPIAATLDDVPARYADAVLTIERETLAAQNYAKEHRRGND